MNNSIKNIEPLGFPWQTQDPFLFCAHHADLYPKGNGNFGPDVSLADRNLGSDFTLKDGFRMYHGQKIPGFPAHPHRGFETVTIAKTGLVDHSDSLGAAGRFGQGDVQWMTAGKGVQHSEMFPLLNEDENNPLEIFQIWLNLPRAKKMVEPHFAMLWHEDIPVITITDEAGNKTSVDVVAGKYRDTNALNPAPDSWAENAENGVQIWTIKMEPHAQWEINATGEQFDRNLYFYKGHTIKVDDNEAGNYHRVSLDASQQTIVKNGDETAYFLLLEGKPISEPVVQHGPFVMNAEHEIRETMMAYNQTQFGGWPWGAPDHVHSKEKGRFALHANGKLEEK